MRKTFPVILDGYFCHLFLIKKDQKKSFLETNILRLIFFKNNNGLKKKFINKNSLIMSVNLSMSLDEIKKKINEKKKKLKKIIKN